jgi:hypothetical protein
MMVADLIRPCTNENCCNNNTTDLVLSSAPPNMMALPKTVAYEVYNTVYQMPTSLLRLASDIWTHLKHEPKKPSWNIQTTIVMGFLQAFRDQSLTNSLEFWRLMLIAPTLIKPLRAKIEPERILLKQRDLCGILAPLDTAEQGTEIEGEWITAVSTWERIYGGPSPLATLSKQNALMLEAPPSAEKIVFYLHGGAYCSMSAQTHRTLTYKISKATKRRVLGNSPTHIHCT